MFQFQWSKEVLNYFKDNAGLINDLELAFAEYRQSGASLPDHGTLDMIAPLQYIWGIHDHVVLFQQVRIETQWKLRVEVVKPVRSMYDELLLG